MKAANENHMKHITTIRFERHLYIRLKELAEAKRSTVTELVNEAVTRYLFNEDAVGKRLDATRTAIDNNHSELKEVIHNAVATLAQDNARQVIQIGELIAMLAGEQIQQPSKPSTPMTFAEVEAQQRAIRAQQRGKP